MAAGEIDRSLYSEMTGASHPRSMFHLHVSIWSVNVCPNTSVDASGIVLSEVAGSTTSLDAESGCAEGIDSMATAWSRARRNRQQGGHWREEKSVAARPSRLVQQFAAHDGNPRLKKLTPAFPLFLFLVLGRPGEKHGDAEGGRGKAVEDPEFDRVLYTCKLPLASNHARANTRSTLQLNSEGSKRSEDSTWRAADANDKAGIKRILHAQQMIQQHFSRAEQLDKRVRVMCGWTFSVDKDADGIRASPSPRQLLTFARRLTERDVLSPALERDRTPVDVLGRNEIEEA